MKCDAWVEVILDIARGLEIDESPGLRAHLEQCAACAARLRTEQALSAELAAVARATSGVRPSEGLEARLLQAFHERHEAGDKPRPYQWRTWVAAAAAVAILAGAVAGWRVVSTRSAGDSKPVVSDSRRTSPAAATPMSEVRPEPSGTHSARGRLPGVSRATFRVVRPAGFVALPGVASLPEFESGTIERVTLALSSLPSYGVDIAPDAASPVEADLLVGQDGHARAIRLVRIASESRSRP